MDLYRTREKKDGRARPLWSNVPSSEHKVSYGYNEGVFKNTYIIIYIDAHPTKSSYFCHPGRMRRTAAYTDKPQE